MGKLKGVVDAATPSLQPRIFQRCRAMATTTPSSPEKALVAATASGINPGLMISHNFPEVAFSYDERDVALYALGVGACTADAVDEKELQLVYHRDGKSSIKVLPTFVSLSTLRNGTGYGLDVPELHYDPNLIFHSQQYIEVYRVIPSRANVIKKTKVAGLHDRVNLSIYLITQVWLLCITAYISFHLLCNNLNGILPAFLDSLVSPQLASVKDSERRIQ